MFIGEKVSMLVSYIRALIDFGFSNTTSPRVCANSYHLLCLFTSPPLTCPLVNYAPEYSNLKQLRIQLPVECVHGFGGKQPGTHGITGSCCRDIIHDS